jgi:hypothetical protein
LKLPSLIDYLYVKIFIAIVEDGDRISIASEIFSGSKKSDESSESFESFKEARAYIQELISDSPYFYISLLNNSKDQGAVPTCNRLKMRDFADVSLSQTVCIDNRWTLYSSSGELANIEKHHSAYGLDFIFSPFSILHDFFKDKIKDIIALYVLIQQESISVAIFSQEQLEFGVHLITDADEIALVEGSLIHEETFEVVEESQDMDELNILDDIEALDDIESLDDIETLDDIDNIESFEDFSEDVDEVSIQEPQSKEEELNNFNLDFYRFSLIQEALKSFYTGEHYRQSFVEAVFIADSVGVSSDLKSYLEEELFVTPIVRKIDLPQELLKLSKKEIDHAS